MNVGKRTETKNTITTFRPSWDEYYMAMAFLVSRRSHDSQTQHGCVITTPDHRVLSCGYNGFPRNIDDTALPNTRPEKYPWMVHAERNALANCEHRPQNGIAYVTGQCCNECIMALWQHGVTRVIMYKGRGSQLFNQDTKDIFNKFVELTKISIEYIDPSFKFIKDIPEYKIFL